MTNTPQHVQLALNGAPIKLLNFQATAKFTRESADTSSAESSTARADHGAKAKSLEVGGLIPFRSREWLVDLFKLAEAVDGKGEPVVYRIANLTAETVGMREGCFDGEISATEQTTQGWQVSFTLKEKNSVSEKKAARAEKPKAKTKSAKATKAKNSGSGDSGLIITWD